MLAPRRTAYGARLPPSSSSACRPTATVGNGASPTARPTRPLPLRACGAVFAGSVVAAAELRALAHAEVVALCRALPRVVVAVFVDGVSVGATASARRTTALSLRPGYEGLRAASQQSCGLPVDAGKRALAATSPVMLDVAACVIGAPQLRRRLHPRKLDVGYSFGVPLARGAAAVKRGRMARAAARLRRAKRWPNVASGQARVIFAFAAPEAHYGTNVAGVAPPVAANLARRSANAAGNGGRGVALGLAEAVQARAAQRSLAALGLIAPLVRYARE